MGLMVRTVIMAPKGYASLISPMGIAASSSSAINSPVPSPSRDHSLSITMRPHLDIKHRPWNTEAHENNDYDR